MIGKQQPVPHQKPAKPAAQPAVPKQVTAIAPQLAPAPKNVLTAGLPAAQLWDIATVPANALAVVQLIQTTQKLTKPARPGL